MPEPILIPCEGHTCPVHLHDGNEGVCAMCGRVVRTELGGGAGFHLRPDVLAMLARGDYDT